MEITTVNDIYSNLIIKKDDYYEVDHFIPRSFISNDEIWNLVPVSGSLNSSKSNNLPKWDIYFDRFVKNQYLLNEMIYKYNFIYGLFKDCKRDNLNSLWPIEELYLKDIEEGKFRDILRSHIQPLYETAYIQGYSVWSKFETINV